MSKRTVLRAAFAAVSSLSILCLVASAHAAQRTFVSTGGIDANACSLAAPCRGFAKAITVTDPGGELVVLDSGGYGSVTVNKNVTILSPAGVYAGISVFAASDGVTVAAPATKVVLRGLSINGQGGNSGIRVQAGEVHVENTVISNMAQAGILVAGGSSVRISGTVSRSNVDGLRVVPAAGAISVLVRDSEFSNNATAGIGVSPSAGGANAQVTVERTSVTKNGAGVVTSPGASATATVIVTQSVASENAGAGISSTGSTATVFVRESAITRNGTGLLQATSGVLNACGANLLVANSTPQSGAITTANCLDVASAANAYVQNGNAFGTDAILGTTDNHALDLRVNDSRVMRYEPNAISPNVIGGSPANNVTAGVRGATIGGGGVPVGDTDSDFVLEAPNRVTDTYGTVGGGYGNRAGDGAGTAVDRPFATVAGGYGNTASGYSSTTGGGGNNTASGPDSTIAGGANNMASGAVSLVAGGAGNAASGMFSTVAGGSDNTASGSYSTVAGGSNNTASGAASFAGGFHANANEFGCFVWGDDSTANEIRCDAANRFVARALGGVFFFAAGSTQPTYTGVVLPPGGTAWVPGSDRRIKENFRGIDAQDVLRRLVALPLSTWNLKAQDPAIRHLGPMAQDFRAAFGLGETELGINTLDADGVAFAAIQGLNAKLEARLLAKDRELNELRDRLAQVESLRAELVALQEALAALRDERARIAARGEAVRGERRDQTPSRAWRTAVRRGTWHPPCDGQAFSGRIASPAACDASGAGIQKTASLGRNHAGPALVSPAARGALRIGCDWGVQHRRRRPTHVRVDGGH